MGNTIKTWCVRLWASAVVILTGNLPILFDKFLGIWGMIFLLVFYFIVNIKPTMERGKITSQRLRFCYSGCELLRIFLISMLISAVYILAMIPVVFKEHRPLQFRFLNPPLRYRKICGLHSKIHAPSHFPYCI